MVLKKTNIKKLDFSKLYKKQMKKSTFKSKNSSDWDKKAEHFNQSMKNSLYTQEFISKMNLNDCETLLDIGSGPATISLALANDLKQVFALDYSSKMLELANENAKEQNITNLTTINRSWEDNWDDVPNADIVVASRSMEVKNIKKALQKLNDKANKRVYITTKVGGSFINEDILKLLNKKITPRPDYIYVLNILHSMKIYAKVDFIHTANKKFVSLNENEFIQSIKWSLGDISKKEESVLRKYFNGDFKNKKDNDRLTWAFISWDKSL